MQLPAIPAIFPRFRTGLALLAALQLLSGCGEETAGADGDPDAQLVLMAPKGGETFHIGDNLRVRWKAQGKGLTEINSVTVMLSPDSGKNWTSFRSGSIAPADSAWGDLGWIIPRKVMSAGVAFDLAGNSRVLVRVQDYDNVSDPHKTAVVAKPISIVE